MQKGNLLLFVASLGIAWVHASTTSPGYCCPQITVALGNETDGTYTFLAEGNGPAMEDCQNACVYAKDSNKTDLYCFKAVTSADLGSGQVQCEALSPYTLLTSSTPAATGPTAEELLKKIEDLQKDLSDQTNKTQILEAILQKEVEAREADVGKLTTEVNSMLNKTEKKMAVCGFKYDSGFASQTTLTFDRVYDEVNSSTGGTLEKNGYFTAGLAGVYYVSIKATVSLKNNQNLGGTLQLSSGNYELDEAGGPNYTGGYFHFSRNDASEKIMDQISASRYVKMAAGEDLYINMYPNGGEVDVYQTTMCVSLYSASG